MKFEIVVKQSVKEVARIKGIISVDYSQITKEELEKVIETETLLEKLTGLRFHINVIEEK